MSSRATPQRQRRRKQPTRALPKTKRHTNVFGDPIIQPSFSGTPFVRDDRIYDFVQYVDQASLNVVGPLVCNVAGQTASYGISFSMLAQVGSFAALFDQYMIYMIEMTFLPRVCVIDNSTAPTVGPNSGLVYSYIDYDDVAAATLAVAQQRANTVVVPGYKPFSHCWKPHQAISGANLVLATVGAVNLPAQWNDANSTTIGHFGLKVVWTSAQTAFYAYDIVTRIHLKCRNVQ